ncbi:MAG: MmcQ/YjbR family DNA-binding protein [Culicoidibacterales bacterium]
MEMLEFEDYCLQLPNVSLTYPFDEKTKVLKVVDKIFAIIGNSTQISLKCDPERAQVYRAMYAAVQPGYHLNKTHWNTITLNQDVAAADLKIMIEHSYRCVIAKMSRHQREQLEKQLLFWQLEQERE